MAIASSGAVSFSDLRTEFVGGSAAISMSNLYRGGSNIRIKASNNNGVNLAASVPTSGTLTFGNFRGTAKAFRYTYTSNAQDQNANTLFGDDYAVNYPKEIVIDAGVEVGALSTSEEALEIPAGGAGLITITNNGTLSGHGGAANSAGGDAFEAAVACTLINNGTIRGGGGGGGTGGTGGQGTYQSVTQSGSFNPWGSIGYGWFTYYVPALSNYYAYWGSSLITSGTQSSYGNTYGGVSSYTTGNTTYYRSTYRGYSNAPNGDVNYYDIYRRVTSTAYSSGGAGGIGGAGHGYPYGAPAGGASGYSGTNNSGAGGQGGTGGGYGQAGNQGSTGANGNYTNGSAGSAGGAAGNYIRGISFVTYTNNGTNLGGTA